MSEKKRINMSSPDVNKMQAVMIDHKTTIYIPMIVDSKEARNRYLTRINLKQEEFKKIEF
jgi:hypothetical protein